MPFVTSTIAALTLATGAAGAVTSAVGYVKQAEANKELTAATTRAEQLRKQQAELQAQREQRKLFQDEMRARASVNSALAAQGSGFGSIAGGLTGNVEGTLNQNSLALSQNIQIGENMFLANNDAANARSDLNTANQTIDLGRSLFASAKQVGQIGDTLFGTNKQNAGN